METGQSRGWRLRFDQRLRPAPIRYSSRSLPRRKTLIGRDELGQEPAGDLDVLRHSHRRVERTPLPANREVVLDGVQGNAPVYLKQGEPLKLRMFIDRSVAEIFVNGRQCGRRLLPITSATSSVFSARSSCRS